MGFSELALLVAGITLAHAAWIVSDLPQGALLAPVAITQRDGEPFALQAFEAATQDEAIHAATIAMERLLGGDLSWALARDGLLPEGDAKVDALVITFWGPGMKRPATLVQRYRPAATSLGFQLLGPVLVSVDGYLQSDSVVAPLLAVVEEGIQQHKAAGPAWQRWHEPR